MRGRMSDAKSYAKGVDIGEVMLGRRWVKSLNPGIPSSRRATRY